MSKFKMRFIWVPLLIVLALLVGVYIGQRSSSINFLKALQSYQFSKVDRLVSLIDQQYVDSVDTDKLIEEAIPTIVNELDPHSVYIPAKDLQATNEQLEGSFSGIGVSFNIQKDTIMVISVIAGGPSERIGLLPGDRIVEINDSTFTGDAVSNDAVMKKLRGEKGSTVKLGIKRNSSDEILDFEIVRGDIPVNSVDASFLIDNNIGFIKISKFGRTTYEEFVTALAKLSIMGAKSYIIDLRGNSGGYMDMAINMVNEFLPKDMLIVYTEGKSMPRSDVFSNGAGSFTDTPVVVLIDEWSASASEIFAGAIQDNDRGLIIGRRSFGKGLVQQQFPFADSSAIRLTIARYHTPSGRSIQKEYEMGKGEDYQMDLINRFEHGEFYSKDSIKQNDSLQYKTINGRTVYGGGGIMPDVFVPHDTTGITSYLNEVVNKGLIYQFAFNYSDKNREKLSEFKTYDEIQSYLNKQPLLDQFTSFAASKGVKRRPVYIRISKDIIIKQIESYIIRNITNEENFYRSFYRDDENLQEAIERIKNNQTIPQIEIIQSDNI